MIGGSDGVVVLITVLIGGSDGFVVLVTVVLVTVVYVHLKLSRSSLEPGGQDTHLLSVVL